MGFLAACSIGHADEKSGGSQALSNKPSENVTVAREGTERRILRFPQDYSIGRLWFYDADADLLGGMSVNAKEAIEARGDVEVPAGQLAGLHYIDPKIKDPTGDRPWDLSPLDELRPSDLDTLTLRFARLPADEIRRLTCHTSLRALGIGPSYMEEEALEWIGKISSLQVLVFGEIRISDQGLEHLKGLQNLRALQLGSGGITDDGLQYPARLTKLEYLTLTWASITDAGLAHLAGLTEMRKLHLDRTKINGAGLVHLAGMKSLERLDLADTDLGDPGLKPLESLRSLRWLNLSRTNVSQAGVIALQRQLRGSKIVSDFAGE
jgi:hypothetical protein